MTSTRKFFNFPKKIFSITVAGFLAAFLSVTLPVVSEKARAEDLPPDVREYLTFTLGRWESHTTYFNKEGEVTKEEVEGFGEKVLIENHINLHSSYNSDGTVNLAFRFYSSQDNKFYLIDVTYNGTWWVVSGKRGEDVMYSEEKKLADGRNAILKITHYNIRAEAFEAVAEISFDRGETWRKISHQDYRKIGENPEK